MREEKEFEVDLAFPGFMLGPPGTTNAGWLEKRDGKQWLVYFTTKELAELYLEQSGLGLVPVGIESREHLVALLMSGCPAVGIVLNPLRNETWTKFIFTETI